MSQLRLEKDDLENVPRIALPEGYILRNFREGDEAGIAQLFCAASLGDHTAEGVRKSLIEHPCFKPERIFLAERDGELVGTASAWIDLEVPTVGYLHMVGVKPDHRGKRLGVILTVEAIHYSRREGFTRQQLATDDWRETALRLYLDLGYDPLITDESHPARWAEVARRLNRPDILTRARRP